jgi:hypothetical protein
LVDLHQAYFSGLFLRIAMPSAALKERSSVKQVNISLVQVNLGFALR